MGTTLGRSMSEFAANMNSAIFYRRTTFASTDAIAASLAIELIVLYAFQESAGAAPFVPWIDHAKANPVYRWRFR
jgi:hypothetical protein